MALGAANDLIACRRFTSACGIQAKDRSPAAILSLRVAIAHSSADRTKGSYYRDKYNHLRARRGPARAIMAIAQKLPIAAFHMLSTSEAFRDLGENGPYRLRAVSAPDQPTPW